MTCKEIIINYLNENGFDGLCSGECGCSIEDLVPCGNDCAGCWPAYKYEVSCGEPCEDCEDDCPLGCDPYDFDSVFSTENKPVKCRMKK